MMTVRRLIAATLIGAGGLLALYGLFLLIYNGDASSGPTYIKIAGTTMDAHLAGVLSLAVAVVLVASGILAARRHRVHG